MPSKKRPSTWPQTTSKKMRGKWPSKWPDTYVLYEASVQNPEQDIEHFHRIWRDLRGKAKPLKTIREDFCGTFRLSAEWVKHNPRAQAWALDLDPHVFAWGRRHHFAQLSDQQQKRLHILQKNVLSVTRPPADLVVAHNFSYWFFKSRQKLTEYFRSAYRSLKPHGLMSLDIFGGSSIQKASTDRWSFSMKKAGRFVYLWQQDGFDPVTHESFFRIHFQDSRGLKIKNVFTYDWRIWSIPEVRECLLDAGFRRTAVYWDRNDGSLERTEQEPNEEIWLASIVGVK